MRVIYQVTRGCVFCGACSTECEHGAIEVTGAGAVIDAQQCVGCGRCYDNCAAEAIERIELPDNDTEGKNDD